MEGWWGLLAEEGCDITATYNLSLPTSLDHNTTTSLHGNDGHSTGEEVLIPFCPWQQLQKYMISY